MNEVTENVIEKWIIGERVTLNAQFIAGDSEDKMFWAKCWYMPMCAYVSTNRF